MAIPAPSHNEEPKENYIFWTQSNDEDEGFIWIIGPNYEKKADRPPILRNVGGFYSNDDVNNPANCRNWYAYKEDDKKRDKGHWTQLPSNDEKGFSLTKIG